MSMAICLIDKSPSRRRRRAGWPHLNLGRVVCVPRAAATCAALSRVPSRLVSDLAIYRGVVCASRWKTCDRNVCYTRRGYEYCCLRCFVLSLPEIHRSERMFYWFLCDNFRLTEILVNNTVYLFCVIVSSKGRDRTQVSLNKISHPISACVLDLSWIVIVSSCDRSALNRPTYLT